MFAKTCRGLTFYNMRDFEHSALEFESMWKSDPYRVSEMDTYSNVLYVRSEKAKLCYLAHRLSRTDRHRPETCVVSWFCFFPVRLIVQLNRSLIR